MTDPDASDDDVQQAINALEAQGYDPAEAREIVRALDAALNAGDDPAAPQAEASPDVDVETGSGTNLLVALCTAGLILVFLVFLIALV